MILTNLLEVLFFRILLSHNPPRYQWKFDAVDSKECREVTLAHNIESVESVGVKTACS